jgi:heme-degrading monooxygenase HmoA
MYARLVRFACNPGEEAAAHALAKDVLPLIAGQPGCESVTVFGDDNDGEFGLFVLWDSQPNADAASAVVRPKLDEHLAGHLKAPPDARLFEVLSA